MNRIIKLFGAALVVLLVTGCVARQGDFTVLSDKLVDTKDFDLSTAKKVDHVTGEDKTRIIVFIPTKANPSLEGAIDDALEKGGGDVLTDATVYSFGWYIPYIYGESGWRVEGDVVKTRQN